MPDQVEETDRQVALWPHQVQGVQDTLLALAQGCCAAIRLRALQGAESGRQTQMYGMPGVRLLGCTRGVIGDFYATPERRIGIALTKRQAVLQLLAK